MRRTVLIVLLLVLTGLGAGCGVDRDKGIFMAAGSYGDLAVVLPDAAAEPLVNRFLARFNIARTFVIRPESLFQADIFPPDKWDLAKGYKNALLLVDLGNDNQVRSAARRALTNESWRRLEEAGGGIVQVKDPWSTYQLLVVVAARDRNSLGSVLMRNADRLREMFENSSRERILRRNRYDGLNDGLMTSLWQRHGVFMEIPATFQGNQDGPHGFEGFELMQNGPSRGISVSWRHHDAPAELLSDRDFLLEMRRELGTVMHDEDLVDETLLWHETELGGVTAVKLEGAWNSNRFAGGGPFWCYFVPDQDSGRLFCLDLLVFAPGMDKTVFFRRLDAIAATFSTTRPQP